MKTRVGALMLLGGGICVSFGQESDEKKPPAEASYFRDVWPIMQRRCQGCHQPALKRGNLDLTHYGGLLAGGKSGRTLVPGDPDGSLVISMLTGELEPRMPQDQEPLRSEEIELFRLWIKAGARDDTPPEVRQVVVTQPPVYHLPPVITALAYSPHGDLLAVSGYREVLLHRSDRAGPEARLIGISDRIQSLAFTPDGKTLVAAGGTPARFGEVQFWDVASRTLKNSVTACYDTVFGASLSPDGSKVAFGCSDHTVRVHELATGKELLRTSHHENWVLGTAFGADGKRIISVGRDQAAKLTDANTGAFLENINLLRGELNAVARHPLRDEVVIGGEDRIPYYYKMDRPRKMEIADDSTLVRRFERQRGEIFALAFSPDGGKMAVGGAGGEICIYDAATGASLATCAGHRGAYALAFHPARPELAAGGFDGKVRILDLRSGRLLREFVPVPLGLN